MIRKAFNNVAVALALVAAFILPVAQSASAQDAGGYYREVVFSDANVVAADETSSAFTGFSPADLAAFSISCTEDSGTAMLDIAVQRSVNNGASWATLVAFTQLSASGSETKLYADVRAASAQMIGNDLRINFDVSGSGQYTCGVTGALEG